MEAIITFLLDKGLIPLAIIIAGWVAARYLAPYLAAHPNAKKTATDIAVIADDVATILVANFPDATWDDNLKKLIGKLREVLDLKEETIDRVANAALLRAKVAAVTIPPMIPLRDLTITGDFTEK
jgi:hypothetical protein